MRPRQTVSPAHRVAALLVAAAAAGCAGYGPAGPAPTEADFASIRPGTRSEEVLARFGRPTWAFGVRQENLTIWNYRYDRHACIVYQVSVRPDGTVRDVGTGPDPWCDGPNSRD